MKTKTENQYKGYTKKEWEEKIKLFYANYENSDISTINCGYDDNGNYTATIIFKNGASEKYKFDDKTGYAQERTSKVTIDFVNAKIVNQTKDFSKLFTDNICLAVGYVSKDTEAQFVKKYFDTYEVYRTLTEYDFRDDFERQSQYEDKFVIIPQDNSVKVSLYDCIINDNGELIKKNRLIDSVSEPFIIKYQNAESTMPQYIVELKVDGFQDEFPLTFSGNDGKLVLTEHETEVRDITIY